MIVTLKDLEYNILYMTLLTYIIHTLYLFLYHSKPITKSLVINNNAFVSGNFPKPYSVLICTFSGDVIV